MKTVDKYVEFKSKYKDYVVIVKSGIKAAGKVNEAHELVDFTPVVEETKEADVATETPVETAE